MKEFFLRLIGKEVKGSKDIAKERLKLVLFHDKSDCPAQTMELIRAEMMEILKKYMEIDEENIDFKIVKNENESGLKVSPSLMANIPLKNMK